MLEPMYKDMRQRACGPIVKHDGKGISFVPQSSTATAAVLRLEETRRNKLTKRHGVLVLVAGGSA